MKKFLLILLFILIIAGIFFVPALLNVSSKMKLKKFKNNVSERIEKTEESLSQIKTKRQKKKEIRIKRQDSKVDSENNNEREITFLSLNPLEEIEWLMQNIYVEDLEDDREAALSKDITRIQWENIKTEPVIQTLRSILSAVNVLLDDIPHSKVLSPLEAAKLRSLALRYSSALEFLVKQGERNVSAKESLQMVLNSYNALMQYVNSLQVSAQIKGLDLGLKLDGIKFEKFFETKPIKDLLNADAQYSFLTKTDIYLKRVLVKEIDKEKTLNFDVEVSGKGIKRLEVFNQYGLYESVDVNFGENDTQTRTFTFNKPYTAKGIYVIKVINGSGKFYYKRYMFYPRVTLFTLENNEYKLPFSPEDYKKLDEFFEIKIIRTRMNSRFIDREYVTSF